MNKIWMYVAFVCAVIGIFLGSFMMGGSYACASGGGEMHGLTCFDIKELGVCVHNDQKYIVPEGWNGTANVNNALR